MQSCPKTIICKLGILVTAGRNGCYSGIVRALLYHNAGHRCLVCDTVFEREKVSLIISKREFTLLSAKIFLLMAWWTPTNSSGTIPKSTHTSTSKWSIPGGMFHINIKSKAKQYVSEWVRTKWYIYIWSLLFLGVF